MVEPAKSTPQFYAPRLRRFAGTLSGATPADHSQATSSIPAAGVLFLMPDAEASISEEPGAGNPHAGICAGAVWATNRPTAMADSYTFGEELRMFPFSWHDEFVIPSPVVADLNVSEAVKRLAVHEQLCQLSAWHFSVGIRLEYPGSDRARIGLRMCVSKGCLRR